MCHCFENVRDLSAEERDDVLDSLDREELEAELSADELEAIEGTA